MAQYYLSNIAVNIPTIVNPAFDTIKTSIMSANQLCQSLISGPANEHEPKLRQMIEQSSTIINAALKEIITNEHQSQDPDVHNEYKPVPI